MGKELKIENYLEIADKPLRRHLGVANHQGSANQLSHPHECGAGAPPALRVGMEMLRLLLRSGDQRTPKTDLLSLDLNLIPKLQVMLQDMGMGGPRKEVTEQDSDKPSVTAAQQIQTFISLN